MTRYNIKYSNKACIEMSKPNSTILLYKVPYKLIKNNTHDLEITNRFVVYILIGKNLKGKDYIYVGKSKNGIDNRPAAHEDKTNGCWDICYILTNFKERTFLNDGTIQFLEDCIQKRIVECNRFTNTTKLTATGTANSTEEDDCLDFLDAAYLMLDALGLDLLTIQIKEEDKIIETENYSIQMSQKANLLFEELKKVAKEVNADILTKNTKCYINFILEQKILFSIVPCKDYLKIYLNANIQQFTKKDSLEDVHDRGHNGNGDTLMVVNNNDCFKLLKEYINDVINL